MYGIVWDKELNGVLLKTSVNSPYTISPPRPVFFEELNILGFDNFWEYPKASEPLLWAIGRRYYYKGNFVAEAKGGDIFHPPEVVITENGRNCALEPINVEKVVDRNKKALFTLENEALDFIERVYRTYKKRGYLFSVAFSGGKDSQAVLDLVTRALPLEDIVVAFSDTTMELSYTYDSMERTKEEYSKKYPNLRFCLSKPHKSALDLWKEFGPPSRFHRWCCTAIKNAPFARTLREITVANNKNKIVVFDGVRAEESTRRSTYERINEGKKHISQINAEVIRDWNVSEVFLYSYYRNLGMNAGYRHGLSRIGCVVCPCASNWSEFILYQLEKSLMDAHLGILRDYTKELGIKGPQKTEEYIAQGQWKKRAGGEGISNLDKHLEIIAKKDTLLGVIKGPDTDLLEWLKTVGDVFYTNEQGKTITGEIRVREATHPFSVIDSAGKKVVDVYTAGDKIFESRIRRVFYKSAYCAHCGVCEIECISGAIEIIPETKIKSELCTHCGNCLYFVEKGCLVAKSLQMAEGGRNMNGTTERGDVLSGFGRYLTFGLRDQWLNSFLKASQNWFIENSLGNKQIESMKVWLLDAELITKNKVPAPFAEYIKDVYVRNKNLAWELIWTNLYYNSAVCKFFVEYVKWGECKSIKEIVVAVSNLASNMTERTINSGVLSLFNTFESSPLGGDLGIGKVERNSGKRVITKKGCNKVHPMAIAYSLYKVAEHLGRRDFTVSEIYDDAFQGGPYKLFGIARLELEKILRGLQENQILSIDLIADLDNIFLRGDISSLELAKIIARRQKNEI